MFDKIYIESSNLNMFLLEADDDSTDEVSVTVAPRKNRGTDYTAEEEPANNVTVAPRKNRGTDYTAEDNTSEETPSEETPPDDNTSEETPSEETTPEETPAEETSDDEATDYTNDNVNDEPSNNEEESEDEATDYTSSNEEVDGDANSEESSEGSSEEEASEETDDEFSEKSKKYNLYRKFIELYERLNDYIEKLELLEINDNTEYALFKKVINNLNLLKDSIYEYMLIRYKNTGYVQSLIYYQKIVVATTLNFTLIQNFKTLL